jgi:hypothetical protein
MQLTLIFLGKKSSNFQYHQDEIKIHEIRATYYQKLFHTFVEKALQMLKKDTSNLVTHSFFFWTKFVVFKTKNWEKNWIFPPSVNSTNFANMLGKFC